MGQAGQLLRRFKEAHQVRGKKEESKWAKLDSFCADLKRLIKYEEKKKRVNEKLQLLERNQGRLRVEESREVSHESTTSPEAVRRKRRIRREDKRKLKEEKLKEKC